MDFVKKFKFFAQFLLRHFQMKSNVKQIAPALKLFQKKLTSF